MAEESAKLRIPYIAAAQAQKHVTHNEAMTLLDTLVQLSVRDKDLGAPPDDPSEGDAYIVAGTEGGGTATGAWIGWETRVARYIDGAWRSYLPGQGDGAGWLAYVLDESRLYVFTGSAWEELYVPLGHSGVESINGMGGDVTLALDDVDDVDAVSPAHGDVLRYDAGGAEWVNHSAAGWQEVAIDAGIAQIDISAGDKFIVAVDGDCEIAVPANAMPGAPFALRIKMSGTHAVTFGEGWRGEPPIVLTEHGDETLIAGLVLDTDPSVTAFANLVKAIPAA